MNIGSYLPCIINLCAPTKERITMNESNQGALTSLSLCCLLATEVHDNGDYPYMGEAVSCEVAGSEVKAYAFASFLFLE